MASSSSVRASFWEWYVETWQGVRRGFVWLTRLWQLATGYAPLLIQMYATAAFDFNQGDNGWLMFEFALMRSMFLIFMFPSIISWGRRLMKPASAAAGTPGAVDGEVPNGDVPHGDVPNGTLPNGSVTSGGVPNGTLPKADVPDSRLPTEPGEFDAPAGEQADEEPVMPPKKDSEREGTRFDLVFLRWSLVVDGALTTVAAFATQRWHIYLGT